jgi:hypothetical protein
VTIPGVLDDEGDYRLGPQSVSTTKPGTTVFTRVPSVAPARRQVSTRQLEELEFLLADPRVHPRVLLERLRAARRSLVASPGWEVASIPGRGSYASHSGLVARLDAVQAELESRLGKRLSARGSLAGLGSSGNDLELLRYNQRGALAQLLAIEEHLQQQPPGVPSSWCARKHTLLCCDHHLAEAVNHASRIDPRLAETCRALRAEAERVLQPHRPGAPLDLGAVARLRNRMREVFGDPTLAPSSSCSVCSNDQLAGLGQGKSQGVRLFDVFVLGPFMVWAASRQEEGLPGWARLGLLLGGLGTILYNGKNYLEIEAGR